MQYFRDTETGALYAFDDDVRCVRDDNGVWEFYAPGSDVPLPGPYPDTLEPTDDPTPPVYVPTIDDNIRMRDVLMRVASDKIAPLQDMVDFDMATPDDVAALKAWRLYRVNLSRIDLNSDPIVWPQIPS